MNLPRAGASVPKPKPQLDYAAPVLSWIDHRVLNETPEQAIKRNRIMLVAVAYSVGLTALVLILAWALVATPFKAGPQGIQGVAGKDGAAGINGSNGQLGLSGRDGAIGPQGPAGVAGATGLQGERGVVGPQGIAGPPGPQGSIGPARPEALILANGGFAAFGKETAITVAGRGFGAYAGQVVSLSGAVTLTNGTLQPIGGNYPSAIGYDGILSTQVVVPSTTAKGTYTLWAYASGQAVASAFIYVQ